MLPLHETVVYPSTVFACFAFRVVDSMHCFSSSISPWCLILLQSLQGTKKQIYSQKMKKFRQIFFESFQSDWRKKNKSIAKYFLGRLQKNMFFFQKTQTKARFVFLRNIQICLSLSFLLWNLYLKNGRKGFCTTTRSIFLFTKTHFAILIQVTFTQVLFFLVTA